MDQTSSGLSPEADGFVPPWAEWDFNEWETCTDTEMFGVCRNTVSVVTAWSTSLHVGINFNDRVWFQRAHVMCYY